MTAAPRLLEEIKDVSLRFHPQSKYQDPEYAKNRARTATELAKLAEEQIRDGIPHLYRYATVWSWTIFEVSIECLWLGANVGDRVSVSRQKYRAFIFSMASYHLELAARLSGCSLENSSAAADIGRQSREAAEEMRQAMNHYLEGAARAEKEPPEVEN